MNRREFAATSLAAAIAGAATAVSADDPKPPSSRTPFAPGKPIEIDVRSTGVTWNGGIFHLVRLGHIEFSLDRHAGTLTAEARGGITTFDEVNYDVSAAVFDESGVLLGTARAACEVPRESLGKCLTMPVTLPLDFGTSLDFVFAKSFEVAVSNRRVLTPDEWQKPS